MPSQQFTCSTQEQKEFIKTFYQHNFIAVNNISVPIPNGKFTSLSKIATMKKVLILDLFHLMIETNESARSLLAREIAKMRIESYLSPLEEIDNGASMADFYGKFSEKKQKEILEILNQSYEYFLLENVNKTAIIIDAFISLAKEKVLFFYVGVYSSYLSSNKDVNFSLEFMKEYEQQNSNYRAVFFDTKEFLSYQINNTRRDYFIHLDQEGINLSFFNLNNELINNISNQLISWDNDFKNRYFIQHSNKYNFSTMHSLSVMSGAFVLLYDLLAYLSNKEAESNFLLHIMGMFLVISLIFLLSKVLNNFIKTSCPKIQFFTSNFLLELAQEQTKENNNCNSWLSFGDKNTFTFEKILINNPSSNIIEKIYFPRLQETSDYIKHERDIKSIHQKNPVKLQKSRSNNSSPSLFSPIKKIKSADTKSAPIIPNNLQIDIINTHRTLYIPPELKNLSEIDQLKIIHIAQNNGFGNSGNSIKSISNAQSFKTKIKIDNVMYEGTISHEIRFGRGNKEDKDTAYFCFTPSHHASTLIMLFKGPALHNQNAIDQLKAKLKRGQNTPLNFSVIPAPPQQNNNNNLNC
ncbi:MAG: hypothetical protein HKM04_10955 [Legionellales bacterium]|nr:hypothetical protein [Legionellales bacterium]